MRVLLLNGSPRKKGTVATLLKSISDAVSQRHEVEWIDVYDLKMKPCIACMKCRPDGHLELSLANAAKLAPSSICFLILLHSSSASTRI